MQEQDKPTDTPERPDLKHDNMEFSAATEGDDVLDLDTESAQEIEDEEITAQELEGLQEDKPDEQAAALVTAETDSAADPDNFLADPDEKDEFEESAYDDEQDAV